MPQTAAIADVPSGRARLDAIDDALRALVLERVEVSRQVQALRRAQGQGGIQHARENLIVAGYVDALGEPGADIALAVLALCRGRVG